MFYKICSCLKFSFTECCLFKIVKHFGVLLGIIHPVKNTLEWMILVKLQTYFASEVGCGYFGESRPCWLTVQSHSSLNFSVNYFFPVSCQPFPSSAICLHSSQLADQPTMAGSCRGKSHVVTARFCKLHTDITGGRD